MYSIRICEKVFPWKKRSKHTYTDEEEMFIAAYLAFSENPLNECWISLSRLAEVTGKNPHSSRQAIYRKRMQSILTQLVERGESDAGKFDHYRLSLPDDVSAEGEMKYAKLMNLKVDEKNVQFPSGTKFVVVFASDFVNILKAAKDYCINPSKLFAFYLYIRSGFRGVGSKRDHRYAGCWKYYEAILADTKISYETYLKYRQALQNTGALYFIKGEREGKPAMFSTVDDEDVWNELAKSYLNGHAWGPTTVERESTDLQTDAMERRWARKGLGRAAASSVTRQMEREQNRRQRRSVPQYVPGTEAAAPLEAVEFKW